MLVHRNSCLGLTVSQVRIEVRNRNIVVEVVSFQVPPIMVFIRKLRVRITSWKASRGGGRRVGKSLRVYREYELVLFGGEPLLNHALVELCNLSGSFVE